MDHATYHEQLEAESGKHVGYNYPLEKSYFNIDDVGVKSPSIVP